MNSSVSRFINPLLPPDALIPDVEARVFPNAQGESRLYLYGSLDEPGSDTWCSYRYKVYSAPLTNLSDWTDHGVSFASRRGEGYRWHHQDAQGIYWNRQRLYAPDVNRIGQTYCLVTCSADGSCLGMAVSSRPEGPFSPARKIRYDDGADTASIDPSLYVEGDQVYLLWGQRPAFHGRGLLGARLLPDADGLYTIVSRASERVLFTGENDAFGFYEGASLRKIRGRYYILYPSDHGRGLHMMSYAVADHPLGPYRFGGDLLDNDGCDLCPGNNHGSFCEINGQWYLFYHRGFDNSNTQRRVCAEKIEIDPQGRITAPGGGPVLMTNHGLGGPLSPYQTVEAFCATRVRLDGWPSGCYLTWGPQGCPVLTHIQNGNCVEFRDFDFGSSEGSLRFSMRFHALSCGLAEVVLDQPDNPPSAAVRLQLENPPGFHTYCASAAPVQGIHTVYLRFRAPAQALLGELASFQFTRGETASCNLTAAGV